MLYNSLSYFRLCEGLFWFKEWGQDEGRKGNVKGRVRLINGGEKMMKMGIWGLPKIPISLKKQDPGACFLRDFFAGRAFISPSSSESSSALHAVFNKHLHITDTWYLDQQAWTQDLT